MLQTIQKYKISLIIISIILFIVIFIVSSYINRKQVINIQQNRQFDPSLIGNNAEFNRNVEQTFKESTTFLRQDSMVSFMIKDTPYKGTHFRIAYNYDKFKVEVILDKNNHEAAEKEFNEFLNRYGITNKNWIRNLEITEE